MRFTVSHQTENELNLVVLHDNQSGTQAAILPAFGAILHSFSVQTSRGPVNVIENYAGLGELRQLLNTSYRSSKLSPFVCRIPDGKYRFAGREYEFRRKFTDGSAIHGILFDKAFEVTDELGSDASASVTLQYHYLGDDEGYPFHYRCLVRYILRKDGMLLVETAVLNTGKQPLPIADGWHPYFTLGGSSDDWQLSFHASTMVEFNDKLIPTGRLVPNTLFSTPQRIGDSFLDNCFHVDRQQGGPACTLSNPANGLRLQFFPGDHYPHLQIYTPPHRRSIAIENLSGTPDCFNNGMGLLVLEPNKSQTFTVGYQLSAS